MSFTHFSGPIRAGTVRNGGVTTRNAGSVALIQSATVPATVALTSNPVAQALFTLPAGSKVLKFFVEKTVAATGNSVSQIALTIGDGTTADKYLTSANLATTVGQTTQATLDTATVSAQTDNIGTSDVTMYGTFTATTGNPTAGSISVSVLYVQRTSAGVAHPASA
jgi:hypothetical protein